MGRRGGWSGWSSGPRCGASTSSVACRSRRSRGATGLSRNTIRRALRSEGPPGYRAGAGRVEARSVQGRRSIGCSRAIRSCPGSGSASCSSRWAARAARRSSMTICARSGRCSRRRRRTFQRTVYRPGEICQFDLWQPRERGAGRARPDAPRLGRRRVLGLLARGRRRVGVLQADRGPAGRDRRLPASAWAACRRMLVWDRQAGIHGHGGRPTRGVRRVLRPAAGRLAVLRAGRSAGQGRRRAAAGLRGDQLRARPRVRQRARLPGPARRLVRRRSTRARTRRCARGRSTGSPTSSR